MVQRVAKGGPWVGTGVVGYPGWVGSHTVIEGPGAVANMFPDFVPCGYSTRVATRCPRGPVHSRIHAQST